MNRIGRFELDCETRTLRCGTERMRIGSRAFDILALLASKRGSLVTKDELIHYVWPKTVVEDNNLQVHLSALRKILGPDRDLIVTLAGRGYQLASQLAEDLRVATTGTATAAPSDAERAPARASRDKPLIVDRLFGRDTVISQIAGMLRRDRIVTLVGAGGIGKTCLATNVARQVADQFADGVCFVELAAHSSKEAILTAVADAYGLVSADGAITPAQIATAFIGRDLLIVLDNAEHVIEAVADLTEVLTRHSADLRVLVTSREPLRIHSESVFQIHPLDVPARNSQSQEALSYSAVQLFLHRARALQPRFGRDPACLALVGEVCRRLDGIPLAIELAAARAATLGIDGLHRRLDDRLNLLTGGRRTALPRHQTLRATFDWSYALLNPTARAVFRRCSQFDSTFSIDDACAVSADASITSTQVMASVSDLAEKSLLGVEFIGTSIAYRFPESTRAYGREKLRDEGEAERAAMGYVRCLQRRFECDSYSSATSGTTREALDALDWAFSLWVGPRENRTRDNA